MLFWRQKKCKNRPPISCTRLIGVVAGSAHPFPKGFSQLTGSSDQNGVNFPPNRSKLPEMLVKNGVFMHDNGRKGPWSDWLHWIRPLQCQSTLFSLIVVGFLEKRMKNAPKSVKICFAKCCLTLTGHISDFWEYTFAVFGYMLAPLKDSRWRENKKNSMVMKVPNWPLEIAPKKNWDLRFGQIYFWRP